MRISTIRRACLQNVLSSRGPQKRAVAIQLDDFVGSRSGPSRNDTIVKRPNIACLRGFTLVELMVAATLGAMVLAAVLTTNLELMRSGARVTQYAEMSSQVRRGIEQFEGDVKSAITITWNGASDITLTLPTQSGTTSQVTYAWTNATQSFFLVPGASSAATVGRIYLVRGIPLLADGSAGLTFARYDRDGNAATTDLATKKVQVSLNVVRSAANTAGTDTAVSAIFVLRNKP